MELTKYAPPVRRARRLVRALASRKSVTLALLVVLSASGASGCGSDEGTGPPSDVVASVTVTPDTATLLTSDDYVSLRAAPENAGGERISDKVVTWASSDEGVAAVAPNGTVTPVDNGSAIITGTVDSVSGTATITVDLGMRITAIAPADTNFAACIESLDAEFAHDVISIDCTDQGVTDISGVEHFVFVRSLYLGGPFAGHSNDVSDLQPLASLTELRLLFMDGNAVSDLSPLSGLVNLHTLLLARNQITDLTPLSSLAGLGYLQLTLNSVVDISPLASLASLEHLSLGGNPVADIGPVSSLVNIGAFHISNTNVTDLGPVAALPELHVFSAAENGLTDLSPLAGVTSLRSLYLRENKISDLSPLAGLSNLENLELQVNEIADIGPLAGLVNLTRLRLDWNDVSDVGGLSTLTNLNSLWLQHNHILDAGPLGPLSNLRFLRADNNDIVDTAPFASLSGVTYLDLGRNAIRDVSPLSVLIGLDELWLGHNVITQGVTSLDGLANASVIYLRGNDSIPCEDIEALVNALGTSVVTPPDSCAS